jgi:hypothetical protein
MSNLISTILRYIREARKLKKEYPDSFDLWELVRFFNIWQECLPTKEFPLTEELPWITFAAIGFLERNLKNDMRVYEYGAGGSTLFFAKRVKEIITVEHDRIWVQRVMEIMKKCGYQNWQIRLVEPTPDPLHAGKDPADPDAYVSKSKKLAGQSLKDYAMSIEQYPNEHFDVILIDGRARPSCFKHAFTKVKKGGLIVLDNAEVPRYSYVHQSLNSSNWLKYTFHGPGPCGFRFWQTCIWQLGK